MSEPSFDLALWDVCPQETDRSDHEEEQDDDLDGVIDEEIQGLRCKRFSCEADERIDEIVYCSLEHEHSQPQLFFDFFSSVESSLSSSFARNPFFFFSFSIVVISL